MEIVGFWTPEYLAHRRETLQQFRHHKIIIAVPEKSLRENATIQRKCAGLQNNIKTETVDGNSGKNAKQKQFIAI